MIFLQTLLLEARQATPKEIAEVKRIIDGYVSPSASYDDIVMRLTAFTTGTKEPRKDVDKAIDILPVIKELVDKGFIAPVGNGKYKRKDAVSQIMLRVANKAVNNALDGQPTKDGRLNLTQTAQMGHLSGSDEAGAKLDRAPRNYKQGGKFSGATKEYIIKITKERDPEWNALSGDTKDIITRLQSLAVPAYAFAVLKSLLVLRSKKKGYVPFVAHVEDNFKDQAFVDALYDLQSAGILDVKTNTINNDAVKNIRNAIEFFKETPVEGIAQIDKVSAFLPNFMKAAVSSSAGTFRAVNNIVTNKEFAPIIAIINTRLTDDRLDDILGADNAELKKNKTLYIIKYLATNLKAETVEELKAAIETKRNNREDFKSDANVQAKSIGRMEEFIKIYDI